jgi:hypothetical protein
MFTKGFDKYACIGDTITCEKDGFTVTARIEEDPGMGPPWKEHDGHGVVSEWRPKNSKRPSERILCEDRGSCRFYDWAESVQIARRDRWGSPPYGTGTEGERAERAAQRDFESMKAWCNDAWRWCTIVLSVSKNDVELDEYAACLCGLEMNHPQSENGNDYLTEVANELLDEAVESAEKSRVLMIAALAADQ